MSVISPEGPAAGLPFAQASALLRHQALASARQMLGAAYPFVAEAQWHQAFEELQLPLYRSGDGPASLSTDGFTALVQHLEARYRTTTTAAPAAIAAVSIPSAAAKSIKQTYSVYPDLATQLERVSYWSRQTRSSLVNQALTHWLSQYPEASIPVPNS
jgi:hypothetical protein